MRPLLADNAAAPLAFVVKVKEHAPSTSATTGPVLPPTRTVARPTSSIATLMSISALMLSSSRSRSSSSSAWVLEFAGVRVRLRLTRDTPSARLLSRRAVSWPCSASSVAAAASVRPVPANAEASADASSSITDRGADAAGSAATPFAAVKNAVRRWLSWLPDSAPSIRSSHITPADVRARSDPVARASADLKSSAARTSPVTCAPLPVSLIVWPSWMLVVRPTSSMVAERRE